RLLGDVADGEAGRQAGAAEEVLVFQGHDAQQTALAGAVTADDANLCARVECQPDVLEHFALVVRLAQVLYREDVLLGHDGRLAGQTRVSGAGETGSRLSS